MVIDFDSVKRNVLLNPEKRRQYYAISRGDISIDELVEHLEIISGAHAANIHEVIGLFIKEILDNYEDGDILKVVDIGTFRIGIDGEGDERVLSLYRIDLTSD